MEQEQLIFDFIEGALTPESEAELFRMLSMNEDLRVELKSQLAIKNAVKSDVVAFTPKAQSTMNIFNTVGLIPPAAGIVPIANPGFFAGLGSKFSGFSSLIMTGTIASVATAVMFFLFYNLGAFDGFLHEKYGSTGHTQSNIQNNVSVMTSEAIAEVDSKMSNEASVPEAKQPEARIVYKYIYLSENTISSNDVQTAHKTYDLGAHKSINSDNNFTKSENIFLSNHDEINQTRHLSHPLINDVKPFSLSNIDELKGFEKVALEFRGTIYNYGKNVKIDPAKSELSNIGLTLTYALTEEFKVGIDYHRENFYQSFSGIEEGISYNYHQNPSIETFGAILRYNPEFMRYDFLLPFFQINGGLSGIGPVLRGTVGLELLSGDNFKIVLGYGINHLWYTHNKKWFDSSKDGFQIGFGLKF